MEVPRKSLQIARQKRMFILGSHLGRQLAVEVDQQVVPQRLPEDGTAPRVLELVHDRCYRGSGGAECCCRRQYQYGYPEIPVVRRSLTQRRVYLPTRLRAPEFLPAGPLRWRYSGGKLIKNQTVQNSPKLQIFLITTYNFPLIILRGLPILIDERIEEKHVTNHHGTGYEECIVSFLDILGFRSMLEEKAPEEIAEMLEVFRTASLPDGRESKREPDEKGEDSVVRVEILSDAIVRARTMEAKYQRGFLFCELHDLLQIQLTCVEYGVVVRGAVTVGNLHLGDNLRGPLFGPALVRAFEMESSEVVFPRIAVDEMVLSRLQTDSSMHRDGHTYEQERKFCDDILAEDLSGLRYIDYLDAARMECADYGEYVNFLEQHKALVEKGLEVSEISSPEVRRKYNWLKNYHNKQVRVEAEKYKPGVWNEEYKCIFRDVVESLLVK